ncbi:unnamed protein product [Discosporangium mesarthrocarpum]
MAGDILSTAETLNGPILYWGSEGATMGKEESDIKGYDNFTKFTAAVKDAGLADTLSGGGPYTVFAPVDSAFDDYTGELSATVLKNHIVEGKVTHAQIQGDLNTLAGKTLTYGRRFRKTFLDEAMVGIYSAGASKGQVFPVDVECSNGILHAIDVVLAPQ